MHSVPDIVRLRCASSPGHTRLPDSSKYLHFGSGHGGRGIKRGGKGGKRWGGKGEEDSEREMGEGDGDEDGGKEMVRGRW